MKSKNAFQSKRDGKRKVGESEEAPPTIQSRTKSTEEIEALLIFAAPDQDDRLNIHMNPFFKMMIPFDKNDNLSS